MGDFKSFIKDWLSGKRGRIILAALIGAAVLLGLGVVLPKEEAATEQNSLEEYKAKLEDSLAQMCESVDGAGRCRVMVSFESGESLEYKGGNLIASSPPKVLGVTVLCRGGDKDRIKSEITEMMSALFDIGKNRICVLKLSS